MEAPAALSLSDRLHRDIAGSGPISFRDFMARALYDPAGGYYTSGRAKIGRKGDFFTSVSVGALFGRLLARQFLRVWELLDRPQPFDLVEQGAHDGTLALDVTTAMKAFCPDCPVQLTLVEPAAYWRNQQETRTFPCPVRWVASPGELPPIVGVQYSNELLDAFPVHLIHRTPEGWQERFVAVDEKGFRFVDLPPSSPELGRHLACMPDMPVGAVTEVNLEAFTWMKQMGDRVDRGMILVIDYGFPRAEYYAPHRIAGTLEAIAAHRKQPDVLAAPGEVDLTAHIDFTSVAEAAEAAGLQVAGLTDQHHFLVSLSPLHFADGVRPNPAEMRAFHTLSHPTMLGRAFKVLAATRGLALPDLPGFKYAHAP